MDCLHSLISTLDGISDVGFRETGFGTLLKLIIRSYRSSPFVLVVL